jgi:F-type H+/Na+-transporting ATPase subunit alpha
MEEFDNLLNQTKEYGIAEIVKYPIIECTGLPTVTVDDLVLFETGQKGQVMSLNGNTVEVVTFSSEKIIPGTKVVKTGEKLSIEVGEHLLGECIDPLGKEIFKAVNINKPKNPERRKIDEKPVKLAMRQKITRQLITGISVIDVILPLAKGQRELIVGDRQTGKTWTLINVLESQIRLGTIVIYALIGKEKTEVARIKSFLEERGILKNVIIIASNADNSPSLISITPYSAMTHAEYFRDNGKDVLVILDDMSTHAMYYREMSLMGMRFPGRDSYPGDSFYKHAKLLERAGNFKVKDGEASITTLPVAGTINNMMTNHIVSNLIGITDGHLLFDADLFNRGRRPAVNIFLSVTRVGKQTQTKILRALSRDMMLTLATYEEILDFSHFGAELSEDKKLLLKRGEKIYKFLEQSYTVVVPTSIQVLFLGLLNSTVLDEVDIMHINVYRKTLMDIYEADQKVKDKIDTFVNSFTAVDPFYEAVSANKDFFLKLCQLKN